MNKRIKHPGNRAERLALRKIDDEKKQRAKVRRKESLESEETNNELKSYTNS